ncbi:hypothetical protein GW7_16638 [Heterocephalus glaber]|uniref:Uncharacterized protein n=1 Tax=Heterocephalus glaber TaxID=10181 RepID=G5B788_HETGA|nr:hypothetical protein GW7_16638 [Heterocephalus glaber]
MWTKPWCMAPPQPLWGPVAPDAVHTPRGLCRLLRSKCHPNQRKEAAPGPVQGGAQPSSTTFQPALPGVTRALLSPAAQPEGSSQATCARSLSRVFMKTRARRTHGLLCSSQNTWVHIVPL